MRRLAIACLVAASLLGASDGIAEPATARPVVVELFTSQGCSSCPPADALLGEIARGEHGDPARVLALAFHVDYWDYIGWKDPFALAEATARQRAYAAAMGKRQIYTPQMVVDGRHDVVGSARGRVLGTIGRAAADGAEAMSVPVAVRWTGVGGLAVVVGAGRAEQAAGVWLVGYDPVHETVVSRGENAGRTLREYHVVRSIRPLGPWTGAEAAWSVPPEEVGAGSRFAVLVQPIRLGPYLGAATSAAR